jgi:hypothetical protein
MDKDKKASKVEKNRGEFKKGRSKTGGRKKGTPNKKTALFKDKLGNFDTVEELKFLFETCENDDLKFAICKEFLKYEYPQRKAVDFEIGEETLNLVDTANKIKEALGD